MEEPAQLQGPKAVVHAACGSWTQELEHPTSQEIVCKAGVYSASFTKGIGETAAIC